MLLAFGNCSKEIIKIICYIVGTLQNYAIVGQKLLLIFLCLMVIFMNE